MSAPAILEQLVDRRDLDAETAAAAVTAVMTGQWSEVEIAALLTAWRVKGEAVAEVVGAARAMRAQASRIPVARTGLLDTCGTGGDQLRTFNISTAAALVAAACGVPVAKHGNRSVSSSSGSADVLEALGVGLQLTPEQVGGCIDRVGLGFCFAPLVHGAMKYAAPVRKQLKFRTIFNLLGPLTNPAGATYQLLGASRPETAEKLAHAAAQLGQERVIVVCGAGPIDEVSLWGPTQVWDVRPGDVRTAVWNPLDFGLPPCDPAALRVASPAESAATLRRIFAGEAGPCRDVVLANTAAALLAAGRAADLRAGVEQARAALDSGAVTRKLDELIAATQSRP